MDTQTSHILDKWAKILELDLDRKSFDLSTYQYEITAAGRNMKILIDEYDNSGSIALMYAKNFFFKYANSMKVKVLDLLSGETTIQELQDIYSDFTSDYVQNVENRFYSALSNILSKLGLHYLEDTEDARDGLLSEIVEDIVDSLHSCNVDIWEVGTSMASAKLSNFCPNISVSDTIAEFIICIHRQPDGIYLGYVSDHNSAGGYFSFVIKCNGNIISVNDRVNESFRGQHTRSRNNRWVERKNYSIFPYDKLIEYSGTLDYLGYYTHMELKEIEDLSLTSLGVDSVKIVLCMMLLSNRFTSSTFNIYDNRFHKIYSDTLLPTNISDYYTKDELMIVSDISIIAKHNEVLLDITEEDVLNGNCPVEGTAGFDNNPGSIFIETYGKGFQLDRSQLLKNTRKIEDKSSKSIYSEYVGTKESILLQQYIDARQQLRDYIVKNMSKTYVEFGGIRSIENWFLLALKNNINHIARICVQKYNSNTPNGFDAFSRIVSGDYLNCIRVDKDSYYPYFSSAIILNDRFVDSTYKCAVTEHRCNIWFTFQIRSEEELNEVVGEESVPSILKGYQISRSCSVNSILSPSDPMETVGTPFEEWMRDEDDMKNTYMQLHEGSQEYRFKFSIGFSKRGLNKLMKDDSIVIKCVE